MLTESVCACVQITPATVVYQSWAMGWRLSGAILKDPNGTFSRKPLSVPFYCSYLSAFQLPLVAFILPSSWTMPTTPSPETRFVC